MTPGFFILGNPRSGTSLLRNVLNAHPQLCVPPECGFLLWLWPRFRDAVWDEATKRSFISEVMAAKKFETWDLSQEHLSDVILPALIRSYSEAGAMVYRAYANARGKEVITWGDKNNYYVRHVPDLLELMPEARMIHIVRDPRDVACSYMELGDRTIASRYVPVLSHDAAGAATEWQANNDLILAGCAHLGSSYIRVRYEDLVGAFPETTSGLFAFLNVDVPAGFDDRSHLRSLDEPTEFLQWKAKVAGPVDTGSVGRYRSDLDADAVAAVELAAERGMHQFGYTIDHRT